jgi:RNA polymerase primary sigma factor
VDDDDEYDRSQTDFNKLYEDAIAAEPILEQLVNDIREIQPPQHREWMALIPQYQAGNKYAANRLYEMYLRSVLKIAYQFSKKYNAPLVDTFEDGMEGLLKSFRRYDLSKHGVFPSYYPMWVMQNITRNMAFSPNPQLYLPVHVRTKLYKIFDNVEAAEWDLSSQALIKSVVDELECSAEEAERLLGFFVAIPSLDELLENKKDEFFSDQGAFADELARRTEHNDLRRIIDVLLKEIKPRESQILDLRYGLTDGKERTLEEIGDMLSLTRERIRQIEEKGLRKLRHPTRANKIRDYY